VILQGASLEVVRQRMRFALLYEVVNFLGLLKGKNFLFGDIKDYDNICIGSY